eukprot:TRINITY_DN7288_c0_g1_i4.p1 TRINITY_DN7288_c0_g1~~TRINITY_DN7288_c0_g1_i4.p1  ORF type:complete len:412 (+),score=104.33 TRINITY_DN7288_c0_g1_i4:1026-2261(+)
MPEPMQGIVAPGVIGKHDDEEEERPAPSVGSSSDRSRGQSWIAPWERTVVAVPVAPSAPSAARGNGDAAASAASMATAAAAVATATMMANADAVAASQALPTAVPSVTPSLPATGSHVCDPTRSRTIGTASATNEDDTPTRSLSFGTSRSSTMDQLVLSRFAPWPATRSPSALPRTCAACSSRSTLDGAVKDKLGSIVAIIVGMDKLMFTLIQVLLGDSFHSFMRDIMEFIPWSWLYFYGYIAVAYLVLMNLVTAIIVDNAVTNSRSDEDAALKQKESHRAKELKEMKKLFLLMDADGNGTISWDEFKGSFADATLMKKWKLLDFQPEECKEIFALLDDGDGEIETGEFFEGLARMRGSASSKDVFRLQKMLNRIGERLDAISSPKRRPSKTPSNMSETPCRLPSKRSSNN